MDTPPMPILVDPEFDIEPADSEMYRMLHVAPFRQYTREYVQIHSMFRINVDDDEASVNIKELSICPIEFQSVNVDDNRNSFENNKSLKRTALTSKNVVVIRKNELANNLKLNNDTTDIMLVVDNQKINAHKYVLSLNSEYFDRMFTSCFKERDQDKIEINITGVSYETLKTLIDFFYNSKLTIKEHNVQDLLIGSNILLLEDVKEACVDYLKTMIDVENCITMKDFADSLSLHELYSLCLNFIVHNFRLVADTEMFMTISYDEILLLIKDDNLYAKEDMVYDVVMKWIKHDPKTRSKYNTELVWYVRLPLVLNTYQGIVNVIYEFQGAKMNDLNSFRTEHRKPFRKGILLLSHSPDNSSPEWFDASTDQWQHCICENCQCKSYKTVLAPPHYLCTCTLLDDGSLIAIGGSGNGNAVPWVCYFDTKLKSWLPLPKMMYQRIKPYVVQIGSEIYVIGGHTSEFKSHISSSMTNIECYDLNKRYWRPIQYIVKGLSIMRNNTFVASVNGLIYIIGMDKAGFFNPSKHLWYSIPVLPEKREDAAVCALNNSIYIIGGHINGSTLKSVYAYCTETKVWVSLANMNSPRSHSGAVVMNGFIYVFGGKSENDSYLNTFEIYNPHSNEWTTSNAIMNNKGPGRCNIDAIVVEKNCMLFKHVFEDSTIDIIH